MPKPRVSVADTLAADDLLGDKTPPGDNNDDRRGSAEEKGEGGDGAPGSVVGKNPLFQGGGGGFGAAVKVSFRPSVSACDLSHEYDEL